MSSIIPAGSIFSNATPVRRKFEAGRSVALSDAKRLDYKQLKKVLEMGHQNRDDEAWLAGYSRGIYEAFEYVCPVCARDCAGECESTNWDKDSY